MTGADLDPATDPTLAERLLGREPIVLDGDRLRAVAAGKQVLVTGGGGSIGGELAVLLGRLDVAGLTLLEHSERALFWVGEALREAHPELPVRQVLGSVTDRACLDRILAEARPQLVFHAAAYKHVALVEENPVAGAEVNVLGTQILLKACLEAGVPRFLLISSDKAARPTSLMGASKRVAERLVSAAAPAGCASVRFGNVLGSSGSVLQIFRRRLAAGLPLEVRDPRATRYFMTAAEAGQLLVLAAGLAQPGDLLALNVGSPLRIEELARRLLQEQGGAEAGGAPGAGPPDVVHTRLFDGEKLHESLSGGLPAEPTESPWISRLSVEEAPAGELEDGLASLRAACAERNASRVGELLRALAV